MAEPITISYSSPGAQPPVFIAASWTEPPWSVVEMDSSAERTPAGDTKFKKTFHNMSTGQHQYKFRLGVGDWWVLDEKAETALDAQGNLNNVLSITPKPTERSSLSAESSQERNNSSQKSMSAPSIPVTPIEIKPVPFTVVKKTPDQPRLTDGDTDADSLHEDQIKHAGDAELDVEHHAPAGDVPKEERSKTSVETGGVPVAVVEKTDDRSEHGDDFGSVATPGPMAAHESRAAVPEPDHVIVSPESSATMEPNKDSLLSPEELDATDDDDELDDGVPLFRHETLYAGVDSQSAQTDVNSTDSEDDNEPAPLLRHESLSADDDIHHHNHAESTIVDEDDSDDDPAPLFRHETLRRPSSHSNTSPGSEDSIGDEEMAPLFRHETLFKDTASGNPRPEFSIGYDDDEEDDDEPAPLLRHESIFADKAKDPLDPTRSDDEDVVPLFRHETLHANRKTPRSASWDIDDHDPPHVVRHSGLYSHYHGGNLSDSAISESYTDRSPVFMGRRTPPHGLDLRHDRSPSRLSDRHSSRSPSRFSDLHHSLPDHQSSRDAASVEDGPPPSPLRRGPASRSATSLDVPSPSALDPITEASPSEEIPDPMLTHPHSIAAALGSQDSFLSPLTLLSDARNGKAATERQDSVVASITGGMLPDLAEHDAAKLEVPGTVVEPPLDSSNSRSSGSAKASEHSSVRQRRSSPSPASSDRSMMTITKTPAQPGQNEKYLQALWRALFSHIFGPIGRWLAHVYGGKKNAT